MAKTKTVFVCGSCGYESPKWMGKCPGCNEWNTFYEEKIVKSSGTTIKEKKNTTPVQLSKIEGKESGRVATGFGELDRVLGGGLVNRFSFIIRRRAWHWKVYFNSANLSKN